jgi:REP element-mobilizing transposase RayT
MGSTFTNLMSHVVFSTKNREPMIVPEIRNKLWVYMGGIVKGEGGVFVEIGGVSDHIHMVIKLKPVHALSEIMKKVKGNSSKWINKQNPLTTKFTWQEGFGAFSVSESQLSSVIRYIREQEKHHKQLSFQDEFIQILKLHRVEYDERYIWT